MKLLILGGTKFLGRHFVETALAQGHKVTLFNRGQTNSDLYPEVEKLTGVPPWVPPEYKYFFRVDVEKAVATGLSFRPLADATRDTLRWLRAAPGKASPGDRMGIESGVTPEREAEMLAEWRRTH